MNRVHVPVAASSRRSRRGRRVLLAALFGVGASLLLLAGPAGTQPETTPTVLVTTLAEPITPVIADHISSGVERAERGGYEAYIIQLDTPGGLDVSMRGIVQSILNAEVPVVVYIAPPGARGASAGAIITLSSHIAAMAPGTTIGSATPVDLEGGEVIDKVLEDAAAYSEELARLRERNTDFAVEMVRDGRSVTADAAVDLNVVDVMAGSLPELLDEIDGSQVELLDGTVVEVRTAGAAIENQDLSFSRRILQWLANPNVAFILMSIGTLGIIYELASPGIGAGGVIGVVALVLAFFSLAVLPVSAVGVIFLLLAAALFIGELFAPGVGVFAAMGTVALVLAALFLFTEEGPGVELSLAAVLPVAIVMFAAVLFAGRLALRARMAPPSTDRVLAAAEAEVRLTHGQAQAFVDGAWWSVRPEVAGELHHGQRVRVLRREDLELVVEPVESASDGGPEQRDEDPHAADPLPADQRKGRSS
jgi:membrane-bound serine protease (ClpP class)